MSDVMKLYPSGFLGSSAVAPTEPLSTQEIGRHMFDAITTRPVDTYTGNRDVTQLWQDYLSGARKPDTIEFLEDLILIAKKAFGTEDFLQWIDAQKASPFIIQAHADWIDDTLNFLYGDQPRRYHYNVWERQLVLGEQITVQVRGTAVLKYYVNGNRSRMLNDVIRQWIARGGATDLLSSLYVLFGAR